MNGNNKPQHKFGATCHVCFAGGSTKKCSECRVIRYCSEACQKAHWPAHKLMCKLIHKAAEETAAFQRANGAGVAIVANSLIPEQHDFSREFLCLQITWSPVRLVQASYVNVDDLDEDDPRVIPFVHSARPQEEACESGRLVFTIWQDFNDGSVILCSKSLFNERDVVGKLQIFDVSKLIAKVNKGELQHIEDSGFHGSPQDNMPSYFGKFSSSSK
ncbi:hypothetical protein BDR26DRAFT_878961 [Obelidium mucronatum]|nr:hypothetical protein BDR26DRAFT_878961 [Obelidium mucronatum]